MNVFLDLGTHYGEGLENFCNLYNIDETWIVHTFEANPITYDEFVKKYNKRKWVRHHNKAIGITNGFVILNIETLTDGIQTGEGSSTVNIDKWNPWNLRERGAFKNQIEVESIDFSKFVIDNFNDRDYILCKMDIEGSEYDVLEKMIFDNSIDYIDHIIIEWHSNFFDNSSEMMERQIKIQKILTDRNIKVENWK